MKKAFTMIELVFVVVIIGIMSAVISPNFQRATVKEAANQIVSHIRYTQQLALNDNKFDTTDPIWYKKRWQILFANTAGSDNEWAYTIYADASGATGYPNKTEIAKNPLDPTNKYLTGGYTTSSIAYKVGTSINPEVTKEMNLGHKYGIKNIGVNIGVVFSGGCSSANGKIFFDYIGRPMWGNPGGTGGLTQKYTDSGVNRLIQIDCLITISNGNISQNETIVITPETGYAYIQ